MTVRASWRYEGEGRGGIAGLKGGTLPNRSPVPLGWVGGSGSSCASEMGDTTSCVDDSADVVAVENDVHKIPERNKEL